MIFLHLVKHLIKDGIWLETEISVITPYREQAKRIRQAFINAGFVKIMVNDLEEAIEFYDVKVFTIDSMQGPQGAVIL